MAPDFFGEVKQFAAGLVGLFEYRQGMHLGIRVSGGIYPGIRGIRVRKLHVVAFLLLPDGLHGVHLSLAHPANKCETCVWKTWGFLAALW